MKGMIRIGDITTGGSTVLSGSVVMKFAVIGMARRGKFDACPMPGHGRTALAEGRTVFKDNGIPVAFDGHLCACGGALISSWSEARAH